MEEPNPEIEAILDTLAMLCCTAISGEEAAKLERVDGLLKSLLMSGYKRTEKRILEAELQKRVKERCGKKASHRGGMLSSLSGKIASKFADLARQQSIAPSDDYPPKAAKTSVATDS
jgi:hypothetical protein